ncbi:MAG: bifunctional 4'-phosphopantothenoylcysteine decarboxylase/phosphopantothenoylcysteine synthetase [Fusobacteriia bacterium 4572_132]|nr:MAG: bifunctional 4'-phosphopantothenoylcysteine decarboxylase/phosphopantothenoylcysteine synthetase [Fusobacteriia bacterium 4572_132]
MKNIVIGVTGGIAAYKVTTIISELTKKGYNVDVIMTKNATEIITPLTLETLSKNKVCVEMFDKNDYRDVKHISLAQKADLFLVVPATYNIVGKVASGIADDMLSTVISATKAPVYFALAMNENMYGNPILENNIKKLEKWGYKFISADEGKLACNTVGKGRLKNPIEIIEIIENQVIEEKILAGKKIMISAGRTEEAIDPVRYLSNRSTGKMGYSLAEAARNLGAEVTLISGPVNLEEIVGIKTIRVKTAEEMYEKCMNNYKNQDIIIMTAAVADYKVKEYSDKKIKKNGDELILKLIRNPDILLELGKIKKNQKLVGFAAESNDVLENALKKLVKKNLDLIVANNTENMAKDTNEIMIIKDEKNIEKYANKLKKDLAYDILSEISKL